LFNKQQLSSGNDGCRNNSGLGNGASSVNSDGNFNNKLVFVKQVTTAQVVAMMVVVEIFANGTRAGSKQ